MEYYTQLLKVIICTLSEGSKSSTHYLSDTNRFDVSNLCSKRRICLYRLGSGNEDGQNCEDTVPGGTDGEKDVTIATKMCLYCLS